jgi:hypothetical protein
MRQYELCVGALRDRAEFCLECGWFFRGCLAVGGRSEEDHLLIQYIPECKVSFCFRLVGETVGPEALHFVCKPYKLAATFVAAFVMRFKLLCLGGKVLRGEGRGPSLRGGAGC